MGYTDVFGGGSINPAQRSYALLAISADVVLQWPLEQQSTGNDVASDIMDIDASVAGLNVDFEDARQTSKGFTSLFNNVGSETVTIRAADGSTIISLESGSAWFVYLTDNSTVAGVWRTFQLGASVAVASAAALAGAGLKAIAATLNQTLPVTLTAVTPTSIVDADRARMTVWTGGVGAFDLPAPASVGNDWFTFIRNEGSGNLTLTPAAGSVDSSASLVLAPGSSAIIVTDGSDFYTIGLSGGGSAGSSFDFVELNVAGSGDFVLSGVNLNRIAYRFVGALTGNRNIIVPNTIQEYWVSNETTGAFTLSVKTAAQVTPVDIVQGGRNILYSDGDNVIAAESNTVSFPIPVTQGGTGATTAGGARVNLGTAATIHTHAAADVISGTFADARIAQSNVTQHQAAINHNALLNYVANQHIDHTAVVLSGGDGITTTIGNIAASRSISVDSTVIRTTGNQTLGGAKTFSSPILGVAGSAGAPGYSFSADPDIGMYRSGTNTLAWATGGTLRMTLSSAGNLTLTGDVTAFSDRTLKENLEVIPCALDKLRQINGYTFNRLDTGESRRYAGVIAQEVQEVLPEVVSELNGKLTVAYGNMVGLLIEAVKELELQVAELREELAEVRK